MDLDTYYIKIAELSAIRSKCIKRKVGCIIVKDDRILSQGINGTPKGSINCNKNGCDRCNNTQIKSGEKLDTCKCLHAEMNALLFANYFDLNNSTMYITHSPCLDCSKYIIQCGINNIVYKEMYNSNSLNYLKENGINIKQLDYS